MIADDARDLDLEQTMDAVYRFTDSTPLAKSEKVDTRLEKADACGPSAALWRQTPRARIFDGHRRRILAISLLGDSTLEQIVAGRSVWRGQACGTTILLEPGFECDWRLTGSFEMLHVYLDSGFAIEDERAERYTSPFRDPVLWQYAVTAGMILREGTTATPALFPLLDSIQTYFRCKHGGDQPVARDGVGLAPKTRRLIENHIREALASTIRVEDMAELAGLSMGHFGRAFRQSFGVAPYQYVLNQRMALAQNLLTQTELPIAEIGQRCGFGGASQFGALFLRAIGCSPRAFRRTR